MGKVVPGGGRNYRRRTGRVGLTSAVLVGQGVNTGVGLQWGGGGIVSWDK